MSHKKKKQNHPKVKRSGKKRYFNLIFFGTLLLVGALVGKWSYDASQAMDLSVIGAGSNVIVQVHDPN